jgi:hypothetical protein
VPPLGTGLPTDRDLIATALGLHLPWRRQVDDIDHLVRSGAAEKQNTKREPQPNREKRTQRRRDAKNSQRIL